MDPITLGLIMGGLFAAYKIKRGGMPRRPITPRRIVPEPTSFGGIPPHAFGGRGLRPPVTHRPVSKERVVESKAEERGADEEKEIKVTLGTAKAQEYFAGSAAADVAGAGISRAEQPTTYTRPAGFVSPTPRPYSQFIGRRAG